MQIFTFVVSLVVECLEANIIFLLYRNWRAIRGAGQPAQGGISVLRVLAFGIYIFLGIVLDLVTLILPKSVVPDMFAATIGIAVFLIFGTQPDVLNTWAFWRKIEPPAPVPALPSARSPMPFLAGGPLSPADSFEEEWTQERKLSAPDVGVVGLGLSKGELSDSQESRHPNLLV